MLLRLTPIVLLLVLVGAGIGGAACSNGTTPVCDDAGSCLIVPPSGDAGTGGGDADDADDRPAE
jgi:hypothetical protein